MSSGVSTPEEGSQRAVYLHNGDVVMREPGSTSIPSPRTAQRQAIEVSALRKMVERLEAQVEAMGGSVLDDVEDDGGEDSVRVRSSEEEGRKEGEVINAAWFYGVDDDGAAVVSSEGENVEKGARSRSSSVRWNVLPRGEGIPSGLASSGVFARRPDTAEASQLTSDELFLRKVSNNLARVVSGRRPVVLVCTGAYNPPHLYHTRMFYLARRYLESRTEMQVVGGLLSPRHDVTVANALRRFPSRAIPASHRVAMCELAVAGSRWLAVSRWEATRRQPLEYPSVLKHVDGLLFDAMGPSAPTVMYLCGADELLRTGPETIRSHGVVCCARPGYTEELERQVGRRHRLRVHLIDDDELLPTSMDGVSSSKVRRRLAANKDATDLVGADVQAYIETHDICAKIAGKIPWTAQDKERPQYALGGKMLRAIAAAHSHSHSSEALPPNDNTTSNFSGGGAAGFSGFSGGSGGGFSGGDAATRPPHVRRRSHLRNPSRSSSISSSTARKPTPSQRLPSSLVPPSPMIGASTSVPIAGSSQNINNARLRAPSDASSVPSLHNRNHSLPPLAPLGETTSKHFSGEGKHFSGEATSKHFSGEATSKQPAIDTTSSSSTLQPRKQGPPHPYLREFPTSINGPKPYEIPLPRSVAHRRYHSSASASTSSLSGLSPPVYNTSSAPLLPPYRVPPPPSSSTTAQPNTSAYAHPRASTDPFAYLRAARASSDSLPETTTRPTHQTNHHNSKLATSNTSSPSTTPPKSRPKRHPPHQSSPPRASPSKSRVTSAGTLRQTLSPSKAPLKGRTRTKSAGPKYD